MNAIRKLPTKQTVEASFPLVLIPLASLPSYNVTHPIKARDYVMKPKIQLSPNQVSISGLVTCNAFLLYIPKNRFSRAFKHTPNPIETSSRTTFNKFLIFSKFPFLISILMLPILPYPHLSSSLKTILETHYVCKTMNLPGLLFLSTWSVPNC